MMAWNLEREGGSNQNGRPQLIAACADGVVTDANHLRTSLSSAPLFITRRLPKDCGAPQLGGGAAPPA